VFDWHRQHLAKGAQYKMVFDAQGLSWLAVGRKSWGVWFLFLLAQFFSSDILRALILFIRNFACLLRSNACIHHLLRGCSIKYFSNAEGCSIKYLTNAFTICWGLFYANICESVERPLRAMPWLLFLNGHFAFSIIIFITSH